MTRKFLQFFTLVVVCTLVFSACRRNQDKDDDSVIPTDGAVVESNDAQSQWNDALKISEEALGQYGQMTSSKTSSNSILGCSKSVVKQAISEGCFIGKITIDFGTGYNNTCIDGKVRRGQLIVKYSGKYRDDNTIIQIATNNYYVNNAKVEGRRRVTNIGNYVYNVVDSGLDGTGYSNITTIDGKVSYWKSARTLTWSAGISTPSLLSDDEYIINGNGEGISSAGDAFTAIANAIKLKFSCYASHRFTPVSGTLTIHSAHGVRSLNYGLGDCDRFVLFTSVTGKAYIITL